MFLSIAMCKWIFNRIVSVELEYLKPFSCVQKFNYWYYIDDMWSNLTVYKFQTIDLILL